MEGQVDTVTQSTSHSTSKGFLSSIEYTALSKRRISEDTCRAFRYGIADYGGRKVHCANLMDAAGNSIMAQKLRFPDKTFTWLGDKAKAPGLFGPVKGFTNSKYCVITEGEIDAMAAYQALGGKWPVFSVTDGAAGAHRSLKKELANLDKYERVVLMFDNDEAGQKAVERCVGLFQPGKCFVAKLPMKDAGEMLEAGKSQGIVEAAWNAKEYRPDAIIAANELLDLALEAPEVGHPYPWEGLNEPLMGLRKRELVTFCAGSGVGKSTACRELCYWLLKGGFKVGYIALEESVKKTLQELVGLSLNTRLIKAPREGEGAITKEQITDAFNDLTQGGNLYLYDHFGSLASERLLSHIRYMVNGLGVDYLFLDHLSIVVSGDEGLGDERRGIDLIMTKLRALVEATGVGLFLVSHLKRPEGKGHEEGAKVSLAQLRGSAAIAQLSDVVIGMERNQQSPKDKNKSQLRILKNRYTGDTGATACLLYNQKTGRLEMDPEADFMDEEDEEGPKDYSDF